VTIKLKAIGLGLLAVVLGIACATLIRSCLHQFNDYIRQLNDPWKASVPAYVQQGDNAYHAKHRIFTDLTPAQLTSTLERLSPQGVKHWLRSQPAKWIAIGGKIWLVNQTSDVRYPIVRAVLEQSKGNTELFFPLAAYTRLPKAQGAKIEAACHIYGFESRTLILDDCWQTSP
jgi:hypothetical protein